MATVGAMCPSSSPDSPGPAPTGALRGRGASYNPPNRFERVHLQPDPDGEPGDQPHPKTEFYFDASESILTENDSPDVPYTLGLNVYRGCEHGCAYCYARPYHEYLGWGSGLDFETKILVKQRAPELLRKEFESPRWVPQPITMSGVTDCYQPGERSLKVTRRCLEVFAEFRNPVSLITKNFLVTRDIDLLAQLARFSCSAVYVSVTTLDTDLAGRLEPRATRPDQRLKAIRALADAGIPVGVMVAPIIPGLTDHELPAILDAAAAAGARRASYVMLRLPHSVKDLFSRWLEEQLPGKKDRVLERVRSIRGGQLNVSDWGKRMKGEGIFAEQTHALFSAVARRTGLDRGRMDLSTDAFRRPGGVQLTLL